MPAGLQKPGLLWSTARPSGRGSEEQRPGRAASGITRNSCGNESWSSGSLPASKQRGLSGRLCPGPPPCHVTTRRPVCHSAWDFAISFSGRLAKGQRGGHWGPRGRAGASALWFSVTSAQVSPWGTGLTNSLFGETDSFCRHVTFHCVIEGTLGWQQKEEPCADLQLRSHSQTRGLVHR